jgi:hypothetical protein
VLATVLIWGDRVGPLSAIATHDSMLETAGRAFGFDSSSHAESADRMDGPNESEGVRAYVPVLYLILSLSVSSDLSAWKRA